MGGKNQAYKLYSVSIVTNCGADELNSSEPGDNKHFTILTVLGKVHDSSEDGNVKLLSLWVAVIPNSWYCAPINSWLISSPWLGGLSSTVNVYAVTVSP